MRSVISFTLILGAALTPVSTLAKQSARWDFSPGQALTEWKLKGQAEVLPHRDGLLISTQTQTVIGRQLDGTKGFDTATLKYETLATVEAKLVWRLMIDGELVTAKLPLTLLPNQPLSQAQVNLSKYENWNRYPHYLGLELPAGTQVLLQRIEVNGYNWFEKLTEAGRSFWQFDVLRPSSVNFLWGPHLTTNPIATKQLFRETPPRGLPANWLVYLVIVIAGVILVGRVKRAGLDGTRALKIGAGICLGLWLLLDLRMGLEHLSYAKTDYDAYWSQPIGKRTFRERSFFNDFAAGLSELLKTTDRYVFLADRQWPYQGLMRYYTYPALPVNSLEPATDIKTWVFYRRPDVTVGKDGRLVKDGVALTKPGELLHEYDNGTFIFQVNP